MGKNKKKAVAKRRAHNQRKKQQRIKSAKKAQLNTPFGYPAVEKAPPGFMLTSVTDAMIRYAKPLLELVEKGELDDANAALNISMPLWNYSYDAEASTKNDIVRQIQSNLKMTAADAAEFFNMMIERKAYLCPEDIQPVDPMSIFFRKESLRLIPDFDYTSIQLSEDAFIAEPEDINLVRELRIIDKMTSRFDELSDWEDTYFLMEGTISDRFKRWLDFKGLTKHSENFSAHLTVYLQFVYIYVHERPITLRSILPIFLEEFFLDFIIRKVSVEAEMYIEWSPALKLFYRFLADIGYIQKPEKIIMAIDTIEPQFMLVLREQFS